MATHGAEFIRRLDTRNLGTASHGGCCVVFEEKVPDPNALREVIRRESVTSAWITSSLFNVIVDEAPACLSGLKQILVGGEALSPAHVRRAFDHLPGVRLVNGYGPTENTTLTCCHVILREDVERGGQFPSDGRLRTRRFTCSIRRTSRTNRGSGRAGRGRRWCRTRLHRPTGTDPAEFSHRHVLGRARCSALPLR